MSHSPLCLWKRNYLSSKLRRMITYEDVHLLCEYLMDEYGLGGSEEVVEWIKLASEGELEYALAEAQRRKRRKKRLLEASATDEQYEYAYIG